MKIYPKHSKVWDQDPSLALPVDDIIRKYTDGFAGTYLDPEERDKFTELSKQTGGYTQVEDAAYAFNWFNAFASQLVIPFVHIMELVPTALPGPAQGRGDCQNGSDLVRMSDGSEKQIKDIKVGEYVISATGNKRMVTNVFKKPYNKKMVEISVEGYLNKIASTPDHKYIINPHTLEGKPISELSIGDKVYLPPILYSEEFIFDLYHYYNREAITDDIDFALNRIVPVDENKIRGKNSSIQVNRYIKCDERLAWIIGLYAAEGGIDGDKSEFNRITFNLGSHETEIADKLREYFIDIFGIEPHIYTVPSKPTVIYARVSSSIIASFFKYLVNGNTYTKRLCKECFIMNQSNKIALLKGWFDGDGHKSKYMSCAVSVNKDLMLDFANIATSIEFMLPKTEYTTISNLSQCYGREVKIKEINIVDPENNYVYCIEVEYDHNFICNGFGIFNCVSHSNKNAILGTMIGEIVSGQTDEQTGMLETLPKISVDGIRNGALSTEVFYWFRGHGGDGWYCEASANVSMQKAGAVIRGPLEGSNIDLTKYDAALAGKWGASQPPDSIQALLGKNLIRTAARTNTFEGIRDSLGQGRFIHTCGSEGFAKQRSEHGVAQRQGSWGHAMAYIGADDREIIKRIYKEPLVLVQNSWGPRWISGNRDILDSAQYVPKHKKNRWIKLGIVNPNTGNIMIPEGSFWARWSDIRNRDCSVFAGLNGWKMQKINNWGTGLLG